MRTRPTDANLVDGLIQLRAELANYASRYLGADVDLRDRIYEVQHRAQLLAVTVAWILDELKVLEACNGYEQSQRSFDRIEILTESFYCMAWRIREVTRTLPGLRKFDILGVRNVRNQLLQHPERHDKTYVYSFSADIEHGPRVKPARRAEQPAGWQDPGLLRNAEEFVQTLRDALSRYPAGPGA